VSIISKWPYAVGCYYVDPWENVIHIKKGVPQDIADQFRKDVEAYIPLSLAIFENPDPYKRLCFTSEDQYIKAIVQD
jgi:hypothetical protein